MEPTAGMAGDSAALAALLAAQSSAVAQLSSGQRRAPNPNRAREEQRRELLQLREQAPRLEQALARLKWRVRRRRRQLAAGGGAWRELAASRRELSEQAQRENAQLRAVVQRQIEIGRAMQRMLQAQLRWESVRDSGVPCLAARTETAIFERLLAGVARSFSEVDAIFVAYGTDDALPSEADEEVAPMEIMARRVDGVNARGSSQRQAVSWRYFARPIEYMPWRVSVQPEQPDSEPRKEPTIIESCGVKLYASESFDSEHVYQFLKKTKENERIEIEWGSSPDTSLATLFGGHLSHPEVEFNASRRCPHSDNSFQKHLAASTSDLDAMLQPDSPWGQLTSHSVGEHDFHDTCAESLEVTARKVMPFDVQATGEATWQYLAHVLERVDFRFYYKKDNQNLNVSDNTVVEGFRFELAPHGRRRVCARVHQVLRKHEHTEGRVVMVWRATTDVFEFGGKAVRGACYHEKGYLEVRQATAGSMDGALVQTCYLITPRWEASCMLDAQDRSEVTSTVLSSTTANIITSYQMIESALLDEAVRSLQMWE